MTSTRKVLLSLGKFFVLAFCFNLNWALCLYHMLVQIMFTLELCERKNLMTRINTYVICVPCSDSVAIPPCLVILSVATGAAVKRHTTV